MTILPTVQRDLDATARRLSKRRSARTRAVRVSLAAGGAVLALGGVALAARVAGVWQPTAAELNGAKLNISAQSPPPEQVEQFGVLRRPQRSADRNAVVLKALERSTSLRGVRTSYVRLLHSDPHGLDIVLIPVDRYHVQLPLDRTHHDPSNPYWPFKAKPDKPDALCLYSQQPIRVLPTPSSSWSASCASTREILAGRGPGGVGNVRSPYGLVPDNVHTIHIARKNGPPINLPVHDNFYFSTLHHPGTFGATYTSWLDANGRSVGPLCDARKSTCARIHRRLQHTWPGDPLIPPGTQVTKRP